MISISDKEELYFDENININKYKIIAKPKLVDNKYILDLNDYRKYKYIQINNSWIDNILSIYGGNITKLDCSTNRITNIDSLPLKISTLICANNLIENLDNLPKNLINLICSNNKIKNLNNLPFKLKYLDCSKNVIGNLDSLPQNLEYLNCDNNKISLISNLPDSIVKLICTNNPIKYFDVLPKNLKYLECSFSNIYSLILILPSDIETLKIYKSTDNIDNPHLDFRKFDNLKTLFICESCFYEILLPDNIQIINLSSSNFKKINFFYSNPIELNLYDTHLKSDDFFYNKLPYSIEKLNLCGTRIYKNYNEFVEKNNLIKLKKI